ncbi:MAG TPA: bifunctional nuclease family protein [Gemmatimonas aurantiaca]|nr:bifunctional nuclease family protein [Gemmatimonas aurantiaca]HCT56145.1 bifunctional nuclease family protein [Gemmatimonas aurantiaca]
MTEPSMVEVTVARLGLDSTSNAYVVVLREQDGQRMVPIWIGRPEAESILMQMNHFTHERPLTHDLCKALITGMGGTLRRVNITHVKASTYFAELHIETPSGLVKIDARPSDSIAVALRLSSPVYVADTLLTEVDEDDDVDLPSFPEAPPVPQELTADALKAYLERLQPEDFGRFMP